METGTTGEFQRIKSLSDDIINKIAAGEVIENPAAVVKELVENAIDAGAKKICIQIKEGGKTLIKVTDDGCGMNAPDLAVCYLRHTTSKLRSADDLFKLKTNGFRGEAIASIAAISKLTITTRTADSEEGHELKIVGNSAGEITTVPAPVGTTFLVEDLFFNTPVRRRFLKSTAYEGSKILDHVSRLAMAHPEIRFEHLVGDKNVFLGTAGDLRGRVAEAIGAGVARGMIPVDFEEDGIHVSGLVSAPEDATRKRPNLYLFLQKRPIWSAMANKAVSGAYEQFASGQPACVLFLDMPDETFDVNVHPAKREVRFSDENKVFLAIRRAIREALREAQELEAARPLLRISEAAPKGKFTEEAAPSFGAGNPQKSTSNFDGTPSGTAFPEPQHFKEGREPKHEFSFSAGEPIFAPGVAEPREGYEAEQGNLFESGAEKLVQLPAENFTAAEPEPIFIAPTFLQIDKTYIACEDAGGLLLLDQHAAHSRVLFESALRTLTAKAQMDAQELLFPELLELSKQEKFWLENSAKALEELGFFLEPFGGEMFQLRAIPTKLSVGRAVEAVHDFLATLQLESEKQGETTHEILAKAWAKTNAYRAGDKLNQEEMAQLLTRLLQTDEPAVSPFGRPTMLKLSSDELAKKFKR